MSPEFNYTDLSRELKILKEESEGFDKEYLEVSLHGLNYAKIAISEATISLREVEEQGEAFTNHLAYVVFGRIINNTKSCPDSFKVNCVAAQKYYELGSYINEKLSFTENRFKTVDFSDPGSVDFLEKILYSLDTQEWENKLNINQMNKIRSMGRIVIPENPKQDKDFGGIKHDLNY